MASAMDKPKRQSAIFVQLLSIFLDVPSFWLPLPFRSNKISPAQQSKPPISPKIENTRYINASYLLCPMTKTRAENTGITLPPSHTLRIAYLMRSGSEKHHSIGACGAIPENQDRRKTTNKIKLRLCGESSEEGRVQRKEDRLDQDLGRKAVPDQAAERWQRLQFCKDRSRCPAPCISDGSR